MTYAQYGTVAASDFNNLVGSEAYPASGTLNVVWGTGASDSGYGQVNEPNVLVGETATATQWANLVNKTSNAANHQGSSITSVSAPVVGGTITYLSAIPTNLTTIFTNKRNAVTQSTTTAYAIPTTLQWTNKATWTHTISFANGDATRYFFNSGGQLAITCSHPSGTGINLLLNNLASNVGTIVLSGTGSSVANIAGTNYTGVTKIGGGGNSPTIATSNGYYTWTTSNSTVFSQTASTGPSGYLGTNISILVKTNGTQGSYSDNGNVITVYTVWDEVPNGLTVAIGSITTLTVRPPEVTNIANSWGTISVVGSVATQN